MVALRRAAVALGLALPLLVQGGWPGFDSYESRFGLNVAVRAGEDLNTAIDSFCHQRWLTKDECQHAIKDNLLTRHARVLSAVKGGNQSKAAYSLTFGIATCDQSCRQLPVYVNNLIFEEFFYDLFDSPEAMASDICASANATGLDCEAHLTFRIDEAMREYTVDLVKTGRFHSSGRDAGLASPPACVAAARRRERTCLSPLVPKEQSIGGSSDSGSSGGDGLSLKTLPPDLYLRSQLEATTGECRSLVGLPRPSTSACIARSVYFHNAEWYVAAETMAESEALAAGLAAGLGSQGARFTGRVPVTPTTIAALALRIAATVPATGQEAVNGYGGAKVSDLEPEVVVWGRSAGIGDGHG